jgi:hypothetical protein
MPSGHPLIIAIVATISWPGGFAVDQGPAAAAQRAAGSNASRPAVVSSCTHPLFLNPKYATGGEPWSVAIGNLDGINGPDLVVANLSSDDVSVLLNLGDGTFASAVAYASGDGPETVAVGDLDGDNDLDLAVANFHGDDVSVLLNQGDGTLAAAVAYAAGEEPWFVAIGDLDRAGGLDLAVTNYLGDDVSVLLNLCTAQPCPWDCGDDDASVGVVDFLALLAQWGSAGPCDCEDSPDGEVDVGDFLALLAHWGPCP